MVRLVVANVVDTGREGAWSCNSLGWQTEKDSEMLLKSDHPGLRGGSKASAVECQSKLNDEDQLAWNFLTGSIHSAVRQGSKRRQG